MVQETDYPWEGNIRVTLDKVPRKAGAFSLFFRIPEWCGKAALIVNGQPVSMNAKANTYAEVNRTWKKGDVVELVMDMPVCLLEAHPLAEEIRNQVVVKRGPLVYCLESMDIANGEKIDNILIPADIKLTPKKTTIEGSSIVALEGKARLASSESWEGVLYRPVAQAEKTVDIDFFDLKLEPGDVVLMCSDGLSNMVEDSQLREIISDTSTDLDEKGRILIREANRNGGKDNIAIVLVEPFADEVKAC